MFAYNMTTYLTQGATNREEKVLNFLYGMDCVAHNDIIPYVMPLECCEVESGDNVHFDIGGIVDRMGEALPIDHDLFTRFFEPALPDNEDGLSLLL